ncbi:hypothetical protein GCM10022380_45220 [Amycolatopsis tucumanensis]|uniref:Uncharacterized protein n=1 Tax=Amycolatopsis tucumanensis TaxID=401106 RepID=A0ABP7ILD1_9PSEU
MIVGFAAAAVAGSTAANTASNVARTAVRTGHLRDLGRASVGRPRSRRHRRNHRCVRRLARPEHRRQPGSAGGRLAAQAQGGANLTHETDPYFDTADFSDSAPGNLRADVPVPCR